MTEVVKVQSTAQVAILTLNRPQFYNAMDLDLIQHLADALIRLAADDGARAIVLCGEGKAFCAGGDLGWMLRFAAGPAAALHELAARFHQSVLEIRRMTKPVIAAINGVAAGGGFSLALACDFRVMARSALLRQAYTSRGLSIDGGGTFSLPRLVGLARTLEIVAFDEPISSEQALAWGLVTKVVEDGRALEEAQAMARRLVSGSVHAFGESKRLVTDSFSTSLETQLEQERAAICRSVAHPDGREGIQAFAEKREPVFQVGSDDRT